MPRIRKGLKRMLFMLVSFRSYEVSHALLHDREVMDAEGVLKDQTTKEVEALYPCFYNVDLLNYFP